MCLLPEHFGFRYFSGISGPFGRRMLLVVKDNGIDVNICLIFFCELRSISNYFVYVIFLYDKIRPLSRDGDGIFTTSTSLLFTYWNVFNF